MSRDKKKVRLSDAVISPAHLVVFTAIKGIENKSVIDAIIGAGGEKIELDGDKDFRVDRFTLPISDDTIQIVVKCLDVQGNGLAGLEATNLLIHCSTRLVTFCGIAGSLNPGDYWLGHVIVGTEVSWHGYTKYSANPGDEPQLRRRTHHDSALRAGVLLDKLEDFLDECDGEIKVPMNPELARQLLNWKDIQNKAQDYTLNAKEEGLVSRAVSGLAPISAGKVFSWDLVLNSADFREQLYNEDASRMCVEMESGAISYAIDKMINKYIQMSNRNDACSYLPFRAVSDLSAKKSDSAWFPFAGLAAAEALVQYIRSLSIQDL